jgi:hypothetical protein
MLCPNRKTSQSKTSPFQMQLEICEETVIVDLAVDDMA